MLTLLVLFLLRAGHAGVQNGRISISKIRLSCCNTRNCLLARWCKVFTPLISLGVFIPTQFYLFICTNHLRTTTNHYWVIRTCYLWVSVLIRSLERATFTNCDGPSSKIIVLIYLASEIGFYLRTFRPSSKEI